MPHPNHFPSPSYPCIIFTVGKVWVGKGEKRLYLPSLFSSALTKGNSRKPCHPARTAPLSPLKSSNIIPSRPPFLPPDWVATPPLPHFSNPPCLTSPPPPPPPIYFSFHPFLPSIPLILLTWSRILPSPPFALSPGSAQSAKGLRREGRGGWR